MQFLSLKLSLSRASAAPILLRALNSILLTILASPMSQAFTLDWECEHTNSALWPSEAPQKKKLHFELRQVFNDKYNLVSQDLDPLLRSIEASPADLSSCLNSFRTALYTSTFDQCKKLSKVTNISCKDLEDKSYSQIEASIYRTRLKNKIAAQRPATIEAAAPLGYEELNLEDDDLRNRLNQKSFPQALGLIRLLILESSPLERRKALMIAEDLERLSERFPVPLGCQTSSSATCQRFLNLRKKALTEIEGLYQLLAGDSTIKIPTCELRSVKSAFLEAAELVKEKYKARDCEPYQENEIRSADDRSHSDSPTSISRAFTTQRRGASNIYDVRVTMDLSFMENESMTKFMKERIEKCLEFTHGKIISPEGHDLRLNVSFEKQKQSAYLPYIHKVEVAWDVKRINSELYSYLMDCPSIIHEVSHLLGMVDEYKEKSRGYKKNDKGLRILDEELGEITKKPAYDCRTEGPKDSIMNNESEAFQSTFGTDWFEYCKNGTCYPLVARPSGLYPWYKNKSEPVDIGENVTERLVRTVPPPQNKSLFYPAQIRAILFPHCEEKLKLYFSCAQQVYRTSEENLGDGCLEDRPEECKKGGSQWLQ